MLICKEPYIYEMARKEALDKFFAASLTLPKDLLGILEQEKLNNAFCENIAVEQKKGADGCVILPFSKAFSTYSSILSKAFLNNVREEKDPLILFSHAVHKGGVFIYVPPGRVVDDLYLHHALLESGKSGIWRVHVVVGKGAELHVHESFAHLDLSMVHVFCDIEMGGKLFWHTKAKQSSHLVTSYRASLKEKATFTLTCMQEALFSRSFFHGVLEGNGSSLSYVDFSRVESGETSERVSNVVHKASETVSQKYIKKVVSDGGISRYTGNVSIREEAVRSITKQMHRALMLGENAVSFASPFFDIFQNDTHATHGSTIAPFDTEMLFYAKTRGLEENQARDFLIQAFCDDILKLFPG